MASTPDPDTSVLAYGEGDDAFDAFVVRPAGAERHAERHPAVLVCHAWGGRDAFAEDRARKLAELGYVGAAIDLYGIGKRGTDTASCQALMGELLSDPVRLRRRIAAAYEAVRGLPFVDATRMGAIGFCMGGMCAILSARMGLELRGVVSFHGLLKVGEPVAEKVHAKILVQHGQDDPMVPSEDVGAFAAAMRRVDAEWQLHAYPGVVHAFTNPAATSRESGMAYDAYADRQSWLEMTRFFEDLLKA